MQLIESYFYVVPFLAPIENVAQKLYGHSDSELAREFIHLNQLAVNGAGGVAPGQMLYLPEPVCYHPDLEKEIITFVGAINDQILYKMDHGQRRVLAQSPTLVSNAAEDPNVIINGMAYGNTAVGALSASTGELTKALGRSLKDLEAAYINSFRTKGKLTADFYSRRRMIYRQLDTTIGKFGRAIALGTPWDHNAKSSLKVNTKSQILHWKRQGTGGGVNSFRPHFERLGRASSALKLGGYVTVPIEVGLNEYAIREACVPGNGEQCSRAKFAKRGKTIGSVGVGAVSGGLATYGICNLAFGLPSAGTSFLWCALIAGGIGAGAGGYAGGVAGEQSGEFLYELTVK